MRSEKTNKNNPPKDNPPIEITDLASLEQAVGDANQRFNFESPFWRGHGISGWPLKPYVFREQTNTDGKKERYNEPALIWHFALRAGTRASKCPDEHDQLGWLFLAQHYGLPTRLLDWSESPLIALYFTTANTAHDGEDGCLWALKTSELNYWSVKQNTLIAPDELVVQQIAAQAFGARDEVSVPSALAIGAREIDPRMLVQQAAFTIHSTPEDLGQIPGLRHHLLKFTVPAGAKRSIREHLSWLGIKQWTLFPDLHNLAAYLKDRQFVVRSAFPTLQFPAAP